MNFGSTIFAVSLSLLIAKPVVAEVPVAANPNHAFLLESENPKLAENKRLVYDFWRVVIEAGQMDRVEEYLAEDYIQHNPNVPTGRAAFVEFFKKIKKPKRVEPNVSMPLVAITAERDLVILSFVREMPDTKYPSKMYTTTWFDMFRIKGGKIVEHWDPAVKLVKHSRQNQQ